MSPRFALIAFAIAARAMAHDPQPQARMPAGREPAGAEAPKNRFAVKSLASTWFDATYYRLDLRVSTGSPVLEGTVTIRGKCNQDLPHYLVLDLTNTMIVDSVTVDGGDAGVVQQPEAFVVALAGAYHPGDMLTVVVHYHGTPEATGLGSFVVDSHEGTPWVWTLSEPYGARDWWPCKDHPSDKADSADIIITCDSSFRVGSNGKLVSRILNGDGTQTTHWQERYPIATYLIAITLTNFSRFSNWFHYTPTDSMEVLNYVLPESLAAAQSQLPRAVDGLAIFSRLFGLYPFINEKYGHAQFRSGGMEHETMTSIGSFDEETVIHELAHQWFGDMITCRSWSDLWLNEGFATYCVALYMEAARGRQDYVEYMDLQMQKARSTAGSVYRADTSDIRQLFSNLLVYAKGAVTLHMLRHVLGDSTFFRALYTYANDPRLRYSTAVTGDLQADCEAASGRRLGYFFDEWIYGGNHPHYTYWWTAALDGGRPSVRVTIAQSANVGEPATFAMPIDLQLISAGWDTTVTVFDSAATQTFSFPVSGKIDSVAFDPGGWILKDVVALAPVQIVSGYVLHQNFPNPFNSSTLIRYELPERSEITLTIFNSLGEAIASPFRGIEAMGQHAISWNGTGRPSGVYFYRLEATTVSLPRQSFTLIRKMQLIR